MPATVTTPSKPAIRHEEFCLPRPDELEPRIERYTAYRDNASGRSEPALTVDRCLECGAAKYTLPLSR